MSIIIRLQNLPWNANAADIRHFFQNLTIPDGGVHIVGGENGDAFIAFGSDEDARQAMLLDGGKIKESKIKLLLSSRTEMQKVIELAKQQAITLQNLMQSMAAASTYGATPLSMLPNMLSGIPGIPGLPTLPVSTPNTMTPAVASIPAPPTSQELKEIKATQIDHKSVPSRDDKTKENDKKRSSSRSLSKSRSRSRTRSRSRDKRYRDRYRYRNRSRDRKWHRDRSRSKDRDCKSSRSRSRDRYKRRSRSRDKRSRDKDYKSKDKRIKTYDKKEKSPAPIKEEKPTAKKPIVETITKTVTTKRENTFDSIPLLGDANNVSKLSDYLKAECDSFPLANKLKSSPSQIQMTKNSNDSPKREPSKMEADSKSSWLNSVPMPPMISPWMLSQANDKPVKEEENTEEKNKPTKTTNGEEKVETAAAPMPFGMFPPQFPFGHPFPPPAMYPYATPYPNQSAAPYMRTDQSVAAMPAMQVPPFFNPYQTASPVQPTTPTQTNSSPSVTKNDDHADKIPRVENDTKTDQRNSYGNDDYDYNRKYQKSNNYYSDGYNDRGYGGGGYKRDDYKSDREYKPYDKPYAYSRGQNDDEPYRKSYSRRNFNDENFDRRDNYEYAEGRKYTSSYTPSYPGSVCVEVVNLPRDANAIDIKKFFSPLPLYESSIKFQSDGKGNTTRNAYLKFLNINHKIQALKYSGKILRGNRVTVSDMDAAVYEAAEDYTIATVEQQFLKVSFIPKRAKRQDVLDAFPNAPDDMILMKDKNKDSLVAYLKFANSSMVKSALADKHKTLISNSRVKLEPISEEEYLIARADYQISEDSLDNDDEPQPDEKPSTEDMSVDKIPTPNTNSRWSDEKAESNEENSTVGDCQVEEYEPQNKVFKSNCISMKNLPNNVNDRDIVDFFADINVIPSQIHIMFDSNYKQTGESFCEFSDEHQAFEALSKNNAVLKDNPITICIVPKEEVLNAIGAPLQEKHPPNPRFNLPPIPKKVFPPPRPRMPFGPPGPRHMPPRGPVMPMRRPPGPEHFGKPGCVVGLENIPYKADVEEIIEFFGDFDVQRENIIRRFNESGQATGDARVCLKNPMEAQKAIEELDGKRIRDRVIFVSLVK